MNPNPTDSEGNLMVVDEADYSLNDANPSIVFVYKGLGHNAAGFNLEFRTKDNRKDNRKIVYKPVDYHAVRLMGQSGGRRKSKSKRRKTKRRKSRKNKSRRRR